MSDPVKLQKTETDIREELFYALAEAGLPILEMTQEQANLEKLFLELTEEEGEN